MQLKVWTLQDQTVNFGLYWNTLSKSPRFSLYFVVTETAQPEIFLNDITFNDVLDETSQNKSGANSYDQITPSLIKASAPYVINSVLYIFSCIINASQFPKGWKNIHVHPHYKNGSKMEIKNYRLNAVLCAISIVFEKIVYKPIKKTVERKLCTAQHDFP